MPEYPLPFSKLIRDKMEKEGLGLREFCRQINLDPSFFSKVLSGKRSPPSEEEVLLRIAKVLQIDSAQLIVAAGRIPSQWHRLWTDAGLLRQIHRLATSENAWTQKRESKAAATPPALSWHGRQERLGEELL